MAKRSSATMCVAGILLALLIASIAFFPGRVIADNYGNVTVTGSGTTVTGGTIVVNGAGSTQSNVGGAQVAGTGAVQSNGPVCATSPLAPGAASAGTVSGSGTGGSASSGTATGGVVIGGNGIGGSATGGNATGGNATGGNAAGGSAAPGNAQGGSAIGGSAVGGSAIGGTLSRCTTTSAPTGSAAPTSESGDRALICGTVVSYAGAVLTVSTLTGKIDLSVPAGVSIIGTLPRDGNVCLLLISAGGQIASIQVLQCHGSTSGMVKLPSIGAGNNVVPVGGNECGQQSLHSNTDTISSGSTPSTVKISIDCPDPCSPESPAAPGQGSVPLPTPTTPPHVSPGLPIVLPSGSAQSDVAAAVALQLKDLPAGFQQTGATSLDDAQVAQSWHTTPAAIQASGHVAAFESTFRRATNPADLAIGDRVDVYRSGTAARLWFADTSRKLPASYGSHHVRILKRAGIGNESVESVVTTGSNNARTSTISLLFRRGRFVATITVKGLPSLATDQRARALALVLDSRLRSTH